MLANARQVALAAAISLWPLVSAAATLPMREGTCDRTRIAAVEQRLRNGPGGPFIADSGSAVRFTNGGYQVNYAEVAAVQNSRIGDPVLVCLIRIPQGCPPNDARGRVYTTTNLRTLESWTMADSEHKCGGA
jgi:hypothetical protein